MEQVPRHVLPVLVVAQFAGTSLWFAVNAVMPDLQAELGWPESALGALTSSLQVGFILGTLAFALGSVADRFSARRVFLLSSLAGAVCTLGAWWWVRDQQALMAWRFATGVCLAGIYPVGMKIAAQWYRQGLGAALGLLVGALVLGSASAHGLRAWGNELPWDRLMWSVAALAASGGVLLYLALPEPPVRSAPLVPLRWTAVGVIWTDRRVRASVFGYLGHMWELYTVWVMVPLVLATRVEGAELSWAAFAVLGAGAIGCVGGGLLVRHWGGAQVAGVQLAISGVCCLATPWALDAPTLWFGLWLLLWGITVSGDSPQFSTLTARNAPPHAVGTVLTMTNSLGFAVSIVSILTFTAWAEQAMLSQILPWLALGPAVGLWALWPLWREERRHAGAGQP